MGAALAKRAQVHLVEWGAVDLAKHVASALAAGQVHRIAKGWVARDALPAVLEKC